MTLELIGDQVMSLQMIGGQVILQLIGDQGTLEENWRDQVMCRSCS